MTNESKKKVFLLISSNPERLNAMEACLIRHYEKPVIYHAPNAYTAELKAHNASIDILISDSNEYVLDNLKLVERLMTAKEHQHVSFILMGHPPVEEMFVEEIINGRLFFIDEKLSELEFAKTLAQALNYNAHAEPASYYLRYLAPGDLLIKEGDAALFVYILKIGKLRAYSELRNEKIILGEVNEGEFVGEMAYINNEPRTASIEALTDCELIEIPIGIVDKILFKRPAWAKTLMRTLSKRIKISNQIKLNS